MLPPITPEDFVESVQKLPADLKDTLMSDLTTSQIQNITSNHQLQKWQGSLIADVVAHTLLGKLSPQDFTRTLKNQLGIDIQTTTAIAQDVNRQIFAGVRDSLRDMYGVGSIPEAAESVPMKSSGERTAYSVQEKPQTAAPPMTAQRSTLNAIPPVGGLKTASEAFPAPKAPTAPESGIKNQELGKPTAPPMQPPKPIMPFPPTPTTQQPSKPTESGVRNPASAEATTDRQELGKTEPTTKYKVTVPPEQIFKRQVPSQTPVPVPPKPPVSQPTEPRIKNQELNGEAKTPASKFMTPDSKKPEVPQAKTAESKDPYKEAVTEEDTRNLPPPPPPATPKPEAKLDGNIIDLRNIKVE